jgi:hypothetical protein
MSAPCSHTGQHTNAQENSCLSTTSRSLMEKKENGLQEYMQVVVPLLHQYSAAVSAGENRGLAQVEIDAIGTDHHITTRIDNTGLQGVVSPV